MSQICFECGRETPLGSKLRHFSDCEHSRLIQPDHAELLRAANARAETDGEIIESQANDLHAMRAQLTAANERVEGLEAELRIIAEANIELWPADTREMFREWAQNRARFALSLFP